MPPVALLALYYELSAWHAAGVIGFPLDDAWIHAQFARNLATGHGFTYTGGRWIAGSTSPAWTLLLAFGYLPTQSVLIAAKLLGISLQIVCGVLAARLVHVLTGHRDLAIAGGLLVVIAPASIWGAVSGMELGLASALVLGGFYCYLDPEGRIRRQTGGIALLSLACLARPEALTILGLCSLHLLWRTRPLNLMLRRAARVGAIAIGILGPFVLFDYLTTGRPLPTTFYAKSGPGLMRALAEENPALVKRLFLESGPDAVWQFGATLFDQFGPAAIVALAGFVATLAPRLRRTGAPLIAAAILLSTFSMGLIAPMRLKPENFRYTAQLIALSAVLAVAGLSVVWPLLGHRLPRAAILVALLATVGFQGVSQATVYAASVRNIEQLQVTLGRWMHAALPPDARVAVNDIGAVAYFSGHELIDLEGLVSPEALRYPRPSRGIGFVTATRPDYIAIFPFWYPDIAGRADLFSEVHRVSITGNVVSAGDTLVVYRTPWTRQPLLEQPREDSGRRWPD